jgi:hypothetical protein
MDGTNEAFTKKMEDGGIPTKTPISAREKNILSQIPPIRRTQWNMIPNIKTQLLNICKPFKTSMLRTVSTCDHLLRVHDGQGNHGISSPTGRLTSNFHDCRRIFLQGGQTVPLQARPRVVILNLTWHGWHRGDVTRDLYNVSAA